MRRGVLGGCAVLAIGMGCYLDVAPGELDTFASGGTATGGSTGAPDDSGGLKLDVLAADAPTDCDSGECNGCVGVDLLFVIDNSVSMGPYQEGLAEAFPTFADAIIESLPVGTNLHVGVTSTSFRHASNSTNPPPGECLSLGEGGEAASSYYVTPDVYNYGENGTQGRLYRAQNLPFYDIDTNASPAEISDLKAWFQQAARIGEGGSQIEMSSAAAAWALDPFNADPWNADFIRDEGAVLVLFFIQDEPDQTPVIVTDELLDKVVAAKQACGGADCVVGGGFVNIECLAESPLGPMLDLIGAPLREALPTPDDPNMVQKFDAALRGTLTGLIADTCEIIPPIG